MNFLKQILILALVSLSALVLSSRAYSANDYSMSCTNTAYDGSLVVNIYAASTGSGITTYGVYSGLDCVYSVVEEQTVQLSLVEKLQDQQLTLL